MVAMELAERPRKRRKQKKPEVVPKWEKTRSFEEHKRNLAGLPVVKEDGEVQRQHASKPRFTAKAQKKRKQPDVATAQVSAIGAEKKDAAVTNITKRKLKKMSKSSRMKARKELEAYSNKMESFETTKLTIANIASKVISDPEQNFPMLNELRQMAQVYKGKSAALVILTESQLYKDIAPAYRIRAITEKEAEVKVSKEVARLRTFEESLLKSYQRYVKSLVSLTRWRSGGNAETEAARNMNAVRMAACRALSELARALPHFNESENVAGAVCSLVADREEEVRRNSANSLKEVLGDAHRASGHTLKTCVLIAKQLGNIAAAKLNAAPAEVVEPLVNIQFGSFARLPLSSKAKNEPKKSKRFKQKRRRKSEKGEEEVEETELERDLREGDAEASPQELYGARKGLLDSVCHAYFNIIRSASAVAEEDRGLQKGKKAKKRKPPPALTAALKGLLRIATFISTDVIEAILGALIPLLEADRLPLAIRLRCLSASYAALGIHAKSHEADPDSFTGDARAMDSALYTALGKLYGGETPMKDEEYVTFDMMETIMSSISYRQMPPTRCASVARRLSILATSSPTHGCSLGLLLASQLLLPPSLVSPLFEQKEGPMAERGYSGESNLVQEYDMVTDDPEIANAERSGGWELSCLMVHFHPSVREIATKCAQGVCGDQLPRKTENILLQAKSHKSSEGGFNPGPQAVWKGNLKKKKREQLSISNDAVIRQYLTSEEDRNQFFQECEMEELLPESDSLEFPATS